MLDRDELLTYLADFLKVKDFEDYCVNGLQVEGKREIRNLIFGVSVSQRLFQRAIEHRADMIIVHHGIFWKGDPSPFAVTGLLKERLALLLKNDINLAAYHLPLDAHPEIGNNVQLLKQLNINLNSPVETGFLGELTTTVDRQRFIHLVKKTISAQAQVFDFGPSLIRRVLVISGSGSCYYPLALAHGADIFISGDIRENLVRELEEVQLNYVHAGHYNTEKFGLLALKDHLLEKFDLNCTYIDIPNPI